MSEENSGEVWLVLLTIQHPDLSGPIYIANNNEDVTSSAQKDGDGNPVTFIGIPFELSLPGEDGEQPGIAQVTIPNVTQEVVNVVRTIELPPVVTIQVVLASQPDLIEIDYTGLTMRQCNWDADVIRGSLQFEIITIEPVALLITPERFPGLF